MPKIIQENQVVYVEPNAISGEDDFNSTESGIMKAPDLSDYCIIVDLDVEIKGRTLSSSLNNGKEVLRMEYTSSNGGQKIRFMEGSKIYLDKEKNKYITSLTTSYTNTHLKDLENGGTCEMFGIQSIDINYNHYMVPDVTIQFVDVRGVSLFAQEEMRHNISKDGMDGLANPDIEGSFFKSFFTFPYPKFTLRVKGFYGQMVSYELTCSDFRCAFDSNSGSFNVTAKFVGYAFSFLTDIMANAVLAAPYSEYLGKDYWESNNGTRFTVYDKNGIAKPMKTLPQICQMFKTVQEEANKALTNENVENLPEDVKDKLNIPDLKPIKEAYDNFIKCMEAMKPYISGNDGDTFRRVPGTNSYFIFNDQVNASDKDENTVKFLEKLEEAKKALEVLNKKIDATNGQENEVIKGWRANSKTLEIVEDKADGTIGLGHFYDEIKEEALKNEIEKYFSANQDKLQNWINSRVYYYQDFDFKKIFDAPLEVASTSSAEAEKLIQEIGDKMMIDKFAEVFDFPPTVENITRIFMAHVETFVQMVCDCAQSIINKGASRNLASINMSIDDFCDIPEDCAVIPPFPRVTQEVENEGVTKRENAWIGSFGDENTFEEIRLINGLLKGIERAAVDIGSSIQDDPTSISNEESIYKCPMPRPLSYMDLFMGKGDNPFGSIDFRYPLSLWGHVAARAFANKYCGVSEDMMGEMGRLDAENFVHYFGKDVNLPSLKNSLKAIDYNRIEDYLINGKKGEGTPWPHYTNSSGAQMKGFLAYTDSNKNYMYMLMANSVKDTIIFPVKNWTWKEYKDCISGGYYKNRPNIRGHYGALGTPISKDNKIVDNTSFVTIFDSDLDYIKRSIESLPDGDVRDSLNVNTDNSQVHGLSSDAKLLYITAPNGNQMQQAYHTLNYDMHGDIFTNEKMWLNVWSVFSQPNYYKLNNDTDKAKFFLKNLYCGLSGTHETPTAKFDDLIKSLFNPNEESVNISTVNRLTVVLCGAIISDRDRVNYKGTDCRYSVKIRFREYFNEWVKKEFPKIANTFELKSKSGDVAKNISEFSRYWQNSKKEEVLDKLIDRTAFEKQYDIVSNTEKVSMKSTEEMNNLVKSLYKKVVVCAKVKAKNDKISEKSVDVNMSKHSFSTYVTNFLNEVKSLLNVEEGTVEGSGDNQSRAMTLNLSEDSDDIRVGVYEYIKLLYDKWIASDPSNSFYKMENMFEGERPTFYFVDSAYNKIGKSLYINIGKLVKKIQDSQTNSGLPLIGLLSDMYADNKFNLMFIQNFADRAEAGFMKEMFTPVPYIEAKEPDNHPEYVVLYPYEASSKLPIDNADYTDDGFYLNDATSWPVMISSKRAGVDLAIPAFGVTYGQQYQSYFTNISVDMNSPMATEQSITAKFLVAGINTDKDNNGPRHITAGQDLYSIYANNSYTCKVTMMGCMWVQPMMYFVLNNIPMFRGSYLIVKVNHSIEAGKATTTFEGVRMAKTSTRAVRNYLLGETLDSTDGNVSQEEAFSHANANIGNDCKYAYYSPTPSDGQDFSAELSWKLYDNLNPTGKQYLNTSRSAFKDWTIEDALAAIAYQEFGGFTDVARANRAAVIACMYNKRGCKGVEAYKSGIFSQGWNYFVGKTKQIEDNCQKLLKVFGNEKAMKDSREMVRDIWASGPYKYLVGKKNTINNTPITLEQVQHSFTTRGSSDTKEQAQSLANMGDTLYALEPYGGFYHIIGSLSDETYKNGFVPKPKPKEGNDITQYKENLAKSIEASLRSTQYYKDATISSIMGDGQWLKIVAKGDNANNAVFDCVIQTYSDWYSHIYWDKGNGNMNHDAIAVMIKVVTTPPKTHIIGLCNNYDMKSSAYPNPAIRYTNLENEVNPSLKLAMVKFFKNNGITSGSDAKAIFTTLANIDDAKIVSFFELDKSSAEDSVSDCTSLAGYPSSMSGSGVLDGVSSANAQDKNASSKMRKIQQLFGLTNYPQSPQQVEPHLSKFSVSTIGTDGKQKNIPVQLHKALQPGFIGIMNELKVQGFKINAINSYDWRKVSGTSKASNHSYGVAVDINAGSNGNPWFSHRIKESEVVAEGTNPNWGIKSCNYNGNYDKTRCIWDWTHPAVSIFAKYGWGWGGAYGDTMHFSYLGGS